MPQTGLQENFISNLNNPGDIADIQSGAKSVVRVMLINALGEIIDPSTSNVPLTRTLTINGVTYDLSSNRTWSINLQSVTDVANVTTDGIEFDHSPILFRNDFRTYSIRMQDTGNGLVLALDDNPAISATLAQDLLSGARTYQLPDASGTLVLSSSLGSYVPASRTITINGTAFDLSANRSWTVAPLPTVVSSNVTAANDNFYVVTANATFTDPTGVTGKGYVVHVRGGTATIGGTAYAAGALVYRYWDTTWLSTSYIDQTGARATPLTGFSAITYSAITASDSILNAFRKASAGLIELFARLVHNTVDTTTQTIVNSTTALKIGEVTIPSNTLRANGDYAECYAAFSVLNNSGSARAWTLAVYGDDGVTPIWSSFTDTFASSSVERYCTIYARIVRVSDTTYYFAGWVAMGTAVAASPGRGSAAGGGAQFIPIGSTGVQSLSSGLFSTTAKAFQIKINNQVALATVSVTKLNIHSS